jgi:hypothetical protein
MTRRDGIPENYGQALSNLRTELTRRRLRAMQAANAEMLGAYWTVGRAIVEMDSSGDSKMLVERLADDLAVDAKGVTEVTPTNLHRMRRFAEAWPDGIVDKAVARLPWGHVVVLMNELEDESARDLFAAQVLEHGWSHQTLSQQIRAAPADGPTAHGALSTDGGAPAGDKKDDMGGFGVD